MIVGHYRGFDPRAVGSGNIGMTNVARAAGKGAAAVTFVGDLAKGLLPVLAARVLIGVMPPALAMVGFAAFVGAIASVFLRFTGGRGVATSMGVWLALAPAPLSIALLVFIIVATITRIISLASIGAAIALPPAVAAMRCPRAYLLLAIVMSALVLLRHQGNIRRLIRGEEPTVGSGDTSHAR